MAGCHMPTPPPTPDPDAELIEKGRQIFFNETFEENSRNKPIEWIKVQKSQ